MIRLPPRSTRTDTLFPYTTLFRSLAFLDAGGGYAEEVVARSSDVTLLPPGMDWATAAAFPVVYATSHLALRHRAHLEAGEVLLVHGASGGVGLTAVEIGKALGATVRSEEHTSELQSLMRISYA